MKIYLLLILFIYSVTSEGSEDADTLWPTRDPGERSAQPQPAPGLVSIEGYHLPATQSWDESIKEHPLEDVSISRNEEVELQPEETRKHRKKRSIEFKVICTSGNAVQLYNLLDDLRQIPSSKSMALHFFLNELDIGSVTSSILALFSILDKHNFSFRIDHNSLVYDEIVIYPNNNENNGLKNYTKNVNTKTKQGFRQRDELNERHYNDIDLLNGVGYKPFSKMKPSEDIQRPHNIPNLKNANYVTVDFPQTQRLPENLYTGNDPNNRKFHESENVNLKSNNKLHPSYLSPADDNMYTSLNNPFYTPKTFNAKYSKLLPQPNNERSNANIVPYKNRPIQNQIAIVKPAHMYPSIPVSTFNEGFEKPKSNEASLYNNFGTLHPASKLYNSQLPSIHNLSNAMTSPNYYLKNGLLRPSVMPVDKTFRVPNILGVNNNDNHLLGFKPFERIENNNLPSLLTKTISDFKEQYPIFNNKYGVSQYPVINNFRSTKMLQPIANYQTLLSSPTEVNEITPSSFRPIQNKIIDAIIPPANVYPSIPIDTYKAGFDRPKNNKANIYDNFDILHPASKAYTSDLPSIDNPSNTIRSPDYYKNGVRIRPSATPVDHTFRIPNKFDINHMYSPELQNEDVPTQKINAAVITPHYYHQNGPSQDPFLLPVNNNFQAPKTLQPKQNYQSLLPPTAENYEITPGSYRQLPNKIIKAIIPAANVYPSIPVDTFNVVFDKPKSNKLIHDKIDRFQPISEVDTSELTLNDPNNTIYYFKNGVPIRPPAKRRDKTLHLPKTFGTNHNYKSLLPEQLRAQNNDLPSMLPKTKINFGERYPFYDDKYGTPQSDPLKPVDKYFDAAKIFMPNQNFKPTITLPLRKEHLLISPKSYRKLEENALPTIIPKTINIDKQYPIYYNKYAAIPTPAIMPVNNYIQPPQMSQPKQNYQALLPSTTENYEITSGPFRPMQNKIFDAIIPPANVYPSIPVDTFNTGFNKRKSGEANVYDNFVTHLKPDLYTSHLPKDAGGNAFISPYYDPRNDLPVRSSPMPIDKTFPIPEIFDLKQNKRPLLTLKPFKKVESNLPTLLPKAKNLFDIQYHVPQWYESTLSNSDINSPNYYDNYDSSQYPAINNYSRAPKSSEKNQTYLPPLPQNSFKIMEHNHLKSPMRKPKLYPINYDEYKKLPDIFKKYISEDAKSPFVTESDYSKHASPFKSPSKRRPLFNIPEMFAKELSNTLMPIKMLKPHQKYGISLSLRDDFSQNYKVIFPPKSDYSYKPNYFQEYETPRIQSALPFNNIILPKQVFKNQLPISNFKTPRNLIPYETYDVSSRWLDKVPIDSNLLSYTYTPSHTIKSSSSPLLTPKDEFLTPVYSENYLTPKTFETPSSLHLIPSLSAENNFAPKSKSNKPKKYDSYDAFYPVFKHYNSNDAAILPNYYDKYNSLPPSTIPIDNYDLSPNLFRPTQKDYLASPSTGKTNLISPNSFPILYNSGIPSLLPANNNGISKPLVSDHKYYKPIKPPWKKHLHPFSGYKPQIYESELTSHLVSPDNIPKIIKQPQKSKLLPYNEYLLPFFEKSYPDRTSTNVYPSQHRKNKPIAHDYNIKDPKAINPFLVPEQTDPMIIAPGLLENQFPNQLPWLSEPNLPSVAKYKHGNNKRKYYIHSIPNYTPQSLEKANSPKVQFDFTKPNVEYYKNEKPFTSFWTPQTTDKKYNYNGIPFASDVKMPLGYVPNQTKPVSFKISQKIKKLPHVPQSQLIMPAITLAAIEPPILPNKRYPLFKSPSEEIYDPLPSIHQAPRRNYVSHTAKPQMFGSSYPRAPSIWSKILPQTHNKPNVTFKSLIKSIQPLPETEKPKYGAEDNHLIKTKNPFVYYQYKTPFPYSNDEKIQNLQEIQYKPFKLDRPRQNLNQDFYKIPDQRWSPPNVHPKHATKISNDFNRPVYSFAPKDSNRPRYPFIKSTNIPPQKRTYVSPYYPSEPNNEDIQSSRSLPRSYHSWPSKVQLPKLEINNNPPSIVPVLSNKRIEPEFSKTPWSFLKPILPPLPSIASSNVSPNANFKTASATNISPLEQYFIPHPQNSEMLRPITQSPLNLIPNTEFPNKISSVPNLLENMNTFYPNPPLNIVPEKVYPTMKRKFIQPKTAKYIPINGIKSYTVTPEVRPKYFPKQRTPTETYQDNSLGNENPDFVSSPFIPPCVGFAEPLYEGETFKKPKHFNLHSIKPDEQHTIRNRLYPSLTQSDGYLESPTRFDDDLQNLPAFNQIPLPDESNDDSIVTLINNFKNELDNYVDNYANDVKDFLSKKADSLTPDLKTILYAKYDPRNGVTVKTKDPYIDIKMWYDKVGALIPKIVFDKHYSANFMPIVDKNINLDKNYVQNVAEEFVNRNFGPPILVKLVGNDGKTSIVVDLSKNMYEDKKYNILWPVMNK